MVLSHFFLKGYVYIIFSVINDLTTALINLLVFVNSGFKFISIFIKAYIFNYLNFTAVVAHGGRLRGV